MTGLAIDSLGALWFADASRGEIVEIRKRQECPAHSVPWSFNAKRHDNLVIAVGETVAFNLSSSHSVNRLTSQISWQQCEFEGSILLASHSSPNDTMETFVFRGEVTGKYWLSGNPEHCRSHSLKLMIEVVLHSCGNGKRDGSETGIDCGGSTCRRCG